jgi:hypothetical protein
MEKLKGSIMIRTYADNAILSARTIMSLDPKSPRNAYFRGYIDAMRHIKRVV